jgi:hypothetical protein
LSAKDVFAATNQMMAGNRGDKPAIEYWGMLLPTWLACSTRENNFSGEVYLARL